MTSDSVGVPEDDAPPAAARRRHPSSRRWRTDRDGLATRLAAHLEARGWPPAAAQAAAQAARDEVSCR